jgi:hypothetical protein
MVEFPAFRKKTSNFLPPKMNRCAVFILLLVFPAEVFSQPDSLARDRFGISYFSEGGIYPGFTLNYERGLLSTDKYQVLVGAKAGAYFHPMNHTGLFIMVQSGHSFRIYKGLHFEQFLGIGYLQSFLNGGDAYYVNAAGQVIKSGSGGDPHFMPSVSLGLSYDFKGRRRFSAFVRPMIFWQIPFNEASLVLYGFELGTLFKINWHREK